MTTLDGGTRTSALQFDPLRATVTIDRPKRVPVAITLAPAPSRALVSASAPQLPAQSAEPKTMLGPRGYALAHAGLYLASRVAGVVGFALMPALMMWPEHLPTLITPALGGITASLFLDDLARKPLPGETRARRQ